MDLIEDFGLKPGGHYPAIILHYADVLADTNLQALILLAAGYVVLRFFEAYGLWYQRTWGQWLGALSGGLYVPFELWHLAHRPSLLGVAEEAAHLALETGSAELARTLSKRLRRSIYEFLLALDAAPATSVPSAPVAPQVSMAQKVSMAPRGAR